MNDAPFALCAFDSPLDMVFTLSRHDVAPKPATVSRSGVLQARKSLGLVFLMVFSSFAAIQFSAWEVMALNDADQDGLSYAQEYLLNTQPADPDTDGDGLPDGWEVFFGMDPLNRSDRLEDPDIDGWDLDRDGFISKDVSSKEEDLERGEERGIG